MMARPISGLSLLICAAGLLTALTPAKTADIPLEQRRSGYDQLSPQTKAMQDDDTANPGTFWVLDGATHWTNKNNPEQKSCADCHGDASQTMKGVSARYPVADAASGRVVNIGARINICRTQKQSAPAFAFESKELLAVSAYLARQSRGMAIMPPDDMATQASVNRGRTLWETRQGQLNLSCANCHDDNWDRKLAGAPIPQAHPTGYPVYRLEWQTMGSLQRRLRNCMTGMRAEPYAAGSQEFADLEAFLMWRARGMPIEAPGVRP